MATFSPSAPSFLKKILTLRRDQQNYHTADYHPPWFLKINIKYTFSHISMDVLGFISPSRIFTEFSLKTVYPNMIGENFQIDVVHITGICIRDSKN